MSNNGIFSQHAYLQLFIRQLGEKTKDLEQSIALATKELDQAKNITEKQLKQIKKDYDRTVQEQEAKYQKVCAEHEHRITELSKSHARQCEDLCREILKANSEADRLQGKLTQVQTQKIMARSPDSSFEDEDDVHDDPGFDATNVYLFLGIILLVSRRIAFVLSMTISVMLSLIASIPHRDCYTLLSSWIYSQETDSVRQWFQVEYWNWKIQIAVVPTKLLGGHRNHSNRQCFPNTVAQKFQLSLDGSTQKGD